MPLADRVYDGVLRSLRWISPMASFGRSKVAEGIRGRTGTVEAFVEWARSDRDSTRPLVWVHAPSVGEGLQARAVIEALLERRPDLQVAFTFFSPSAASLARTMPVDVAGYLPWDTRSELDATLTPLDPALILFTKTEVWPGVVAAAGARGIPVALAAATLPENAGRLRFPARALLSRSFGSLSRVLAISPEDGDRFRRLGVPAERIEVTGDPGIDSAWQRAGGSDPDASYLLPFRSRPAPTLVAGSTWSSDEAVLVPAFAAVRRAHPSLRMIVAPHEPDEAHLSSLEERLRGAGIESRRLAEVEVGGDAGGCPVVVVDRVGVLAHLYTVGTMAYVGGGFHRHGLHSVLEPAAAGLPVLFGPGHSNSRAAGELLARGGAMQVEEAAGLETRLRGWLEDAPAREASARSAMRYIEEHRGAAERTARSVAGLLPAHG